VSYHISLSPTFIREVIDYIYICFVLFVWFAWAELLAGIIKAETGKAYNECKTLGRLELDCVKILGHESSFKQMILFWL